MSGFFKKAMGLFVEFEEAPGKSSLKSDAPQSASRIIPPRVNSEDLDKFSIHFEKLFDQANLPGPDYYEFMRMNETLESHIKDDKARLAATFASLSIQGLTKEALIDTAGKYKEMVGEDRKKFEQTAKQKGEMDIGSKRQDLNALEDKILKNSEVIQRLTKEIAEAQNSKTNLSTAIEQEEQRLEKNRQGYLIACEAMVRRIEDDIIKFKTDL